MNFTDIELITIKHQAARELRDEQRKEAVERYKDYLRKRRNLWVRLFPWKIIIIRRNELCL